MEHLESIRSGGLNSAKLFTIIFLVINIGYFNHTSTIINYKILIPYGDYTLKLAAVMWISYRPRYTI